MSKIDYNNAKRIRDDAYIAIDALEGIITCATCDKLYTEYVKEKIDVARRCIDFISKFSE